MKNTKMFNKDMREINILLPMMRTCSIFRDNSIKELESMLAESTFDIDKAVALFNDINTHITIIDEYINEYKELSESIIKQFTSQKVIDVWENLLMGVDVQKCIDTNDKFKQKMNIAYNSLINCDPQDENTRKIVEAFKKSNVKVVV